MAMPNMALQSSAYPKGVTQSRYSGEWYQRLPEYLSSIFLERRQECGEFGSNKGQKLIGNGLDGTLAFRRFLPAPALAIF
jgi:hypothetical protein